MRIISGSLSGRSFDAPKGHRTHPMSDKMRGALFNALGDVEDLSVLDAFAGSGALGFEAISRGAGQVMAIDIDKGAVSTVVKTAQQLNVQDRIKAIRANAASWSERNKSSVFDVVLLDPPYGDVRWSLLAKLAKHTKLNGVVVLSLPSNDEGSLDPEMFGSLNTKTYGDSRLDFYRKLSVK